MRGSKAVCVIGRAAQIDGSSASKHTLFAADACDSARTLGGMSAPFGIAPIPTWSSSDRKARHLVSVAGSPPFGRS